MLLDLLSADWVKKVAVVLGYAAAAVIAVAPEHTIAFKVALAVSGALAGHGVASKGLTKKEEAK